MPLLVLVVGKLDAIHPVLQSFTLTRCTNNQPSQKIVRFPIIFIPNGQSQTLLRQFCRPRFEQELLIVNRIQIPPLNRCLVLSVIRIRIQMSENRKIHNHIINHIHILMNTYNFTNGSENPLLSIAGKFRHRQIITANDRFFVLYESDMRICGFINWSHISDSAERGKVKSWDVFLPNASRRDIEAEPNMSQPYLKIIAIYPFRNNI